MLGFTNAVFSGLTTHELSRIVAMVLRDHADLGGLWHVAGEPIDKHDLLLRLRDALDVRCDITPRDAPVINRALDSPSDSSTPPGTVLPHWSRCSRSTASMSDLLNGSRVLITGGTGSLGQTLVRRILRGELGVPDKLIVFSRDEAKQHAMKTTWKRLHRPTDDVWYHNFDELIEFQIGDVRNVVSVERGGAPLRRDHPCRGDEAGSDVRVLPRPGSRDERAGRRERRACRRTRGVGSTRSSAFRRTRRASRST